MDLIDKKSIEEWEDADRPNYFSNENLKYPYSELPFYDQYHLVKIPTKDEFVEHVDYWGEGRIPTNDGDSGFRDCYNVNRQYQCVSNGPDRDCKIPNRIPVYDENACDTSSYIKNHTVKLVTLMSAPIIEACARDIARIVNPVVGSVVVFGFEIDSPDIRRLVKELSAISMYYCPGYVLSDYFDGLMTFSHMAFLSSENIEKELYNAITAGKMDTAVAIAKSLHRTGGSSNIAKVVNKALNGGLESIMTFAYKLWDSGEKDIVTKNFPTAFKWIFNEDEIEIVSNHYENTKLKLDPTNDEWHNRLAYGTDRGNGGTTFSWVMLPIWKDDKVIFKLKNIEYNMHLRLDIHDNSAGDRKGWGSQNLDDVRYNWKLVPMNHGYKVVFIIVNCQYDQTLKLDNNVDKYGDRQLWGHNGMYYDIENFMWLVNKSTD
ncbi:microvitellogenin-like isoform X2 [Manduca sexta]|uniref:Uncharacterized protein n=1 Tax=Manduca sexta TaxID=7130 RepID=A0A922CQ15_MANSE|nr:microvitellogenin-like isoform X2 [Manduca sexta]XP_037297807.1 microvitellogenin-like isoform X2 [Manduca sexta]KAG6455165.1 hypothetical protein O3G_MSEX009085 [Manduca sexta]KAG6455166.1 hypothetical protein O3G_MSEX009085 [Manduca sexta]